MDDLNYLNSRTSEANASSVFSFENPCLSKCPCHRSSLNGMSLQPMIGRKYTIDAKPAFILMGEIC
jgi:hypothetical protein